MVPHLKRIYLLQTSVVSQWYVIAPEEGGATRVELLVTANFRIFRDSFQCADSTNLATVLKRSPLMVWVAVAMST